MTSRSDANLGKRLKAFVSIAAVFSMVFGFSGLVGWALNLPALVTWGDGTAMAPNAAACFLLAGLSLFLERESDKQPFTLVRKLIARASAGTVGLAGLLTLAEQMFGSDFWNRSAPAVAVSRVIDCRRPDRHVPGRRWSLPFA